MVYVIVETAFAVTWLPVVEFSPVAGLHENWLAPEADKTILLPSQAEALVAVITGIGLT